MAAVLVGAACSGSGGGPGAPRKYRAEAKLVVLVDGRGSAAQAGALVPLATSAPVLRGVIGDLHLPLSVAQLTLEVTARAGDAGDLEIDASDSDASRAAAIANADARQLIATAQARSASVHITIVQPAAVPSSPTT